LDGIETLRRDAELVADGDADAAFAHVEGEDARDLTLGWHVKLRSARWASVPMSGDAARKSACATANFIIRPIMLQ